MIPIQQKSLRNEAGFALVEVLAAFAIAAGIVASVAVAVSVAIKTERRTEAVREALAEAKTIASRLHAGLNRDEVLEGYPDWQLRARMLEQGDIVSNRPDSVVPIQISLLHKTEPSVGFDTIILAARTWTDD